MMIHDDPNLRSWFSKFQVDPVRGFLPAEDPLAALPERYRAWDQLADELTPWINAGKIRKRIGQLPLIDHPEFQSTTELERAMLLLSFFAHAWVFAPPEPENELPANISVPWTKVANQLGRPPIIAHASLVLTNWRRLAQSKPVSLGNLATQIQFYGGVDESNFYLITTAIEKIGAKAIPMLLGAMYNARIKNYKTAADLLYESIPILKAVHEELKKMYNFCDPYIFFTRVRPFIASFENVRYIGTTPEIRSYHGGSAAQSSLLQFFDCALGINYENNASTNAYLKEMRKFMPPHHAAFLTEVEKTSVLRESRDKDCMLKAAYKEVVDQLIAFRNEHLKIVSLYIVKQARLLEASSVGTGGTNPMVFLKSIRNRNEDLK
ncbi:MAG: hypothetical protein AAF502_09370 [Bacteroidota bacterium]